MLKAMVLAAGVGARLQPLSDELPKPLIRVAGRPIMEHILLLLRKHGITQIISNTHHLGDQIEDYFKDSKSRLNIDLSFIHEEKLSGVAGGIRRCKEFLRGGTACIMMGDILTDIDLSHLYAEHTKAVREHNCKATIAQMQVEDTSQFGVIVTESLLPSADPNSSTGNRIVQFQEKPKAGDALSNWANTGVYFFEEEVLDMIPSLEEAPVYDVAKHLFPQMLASNIYMQAISVKAKTYWADLGTPKQYLQSIQDAYYGRIELDNPIFINPQAQIDPSATLEGVNEISEKVIIQENSKISNCIIYPGAIIEAGSSLSNSIIGPGTVVSNSSQIIDQVLA